MTRRGLKKVA